MPDKTTERLKKFTHQIEALKNLVYCMICGKITSNRITQTFDCYLWHCLDCGALTDEEFFDEDEWDD